MPCLAECILLSAGAPHETGDFYSFFPGTHVARREGFSVKQYDKEQCSVCFVSGDTFAVVLLLCSFAEHLLLSARREKLSKM